MSNWVGHNILQVQLGLEFRTLYTVGNHDIGTMSLTVGLGEAETSRHIWCTRLQSPLRFHRGHIILTFVHSYEYTGGTIAYISIDTKRERSWPIQKPSFRRPIPSSKKMSTALGHRQDFDRYPQAQHAISSSRHGVQ